MKGQYRLPPYQRINITYQPINVSTIHRKIYLTLLTLLGGTMVCSYWASNLVWVLMAACWLLEGRWAEKWQLARQSRLLHAVLAVWLLYALSALWSSDKTQWLSQMQLALPLLAVPLVVLTTPPPTGRARRTILWLYAGTAVVVSVIGAVRLLSIEGLPYRDAVPYISHIRFALACCMAIVVCLTECGRTRWRYGAWLLAVWLLVFLLLLRSYTAMAVLVAVSLVLALRAEHRRRWVAAWATGMLLIAGCLLYEVRSYYRLQPIATAPLQAATAGGRPYDHYQDGLIENGNYVNNYIQLGELRTEWARRTQNSKFTIQNSQLTEPCLIRYLNALGLTKDSAGVAALTPGQVEEVARGVPNPVYVHGWPLRRMVYVMLFEYENYRCYDVVAGFTMLQRLELWRAAWRVFLRHPWLGTGAGDLPGAMETELRAMDSPLRGQGMWPHSQYLTWLAMFGALGMALMVWLFARAVPSLKGQPAVVVAWALAIAISCLAETTLGTQAGILIFGFFMAFRR